MEVLNIFSTVAEYTYNLEHAPTENLHTVFFSYILNNDKRLLKYLLEKLLNSKSNLLNTITEDNLDFVTIHDSETLDGQNVYPDMKVTTFDDSLTVYIENKIESTEGVYSNGEEERSQLNDYLEMAKRSSSKENFLLYLTKYNESINQGTEEHPNFGGQFTWSMVSDIIDEYIKKQPTIDTEKYNLIVQFKEYMNDYILRGTMGFKKDYAETWKDFIEFAEIREEYLGHITDYFKNDGYSVSKGNSDIYSIRSIYKTNWNSKDFDGFWINIGFELDFEREDSESPPIVLIAQLGCRKKFFENVKNRYSKDLKTAVDGLEKQNFYKTENKDPIVIDGHIPLKQITEDYNLSKKEQIEKIIEWVKYCVNKLESSELLKLLEMNYPQLA